MTRVAAAKRRVRRWGGWLRRSRAWPLVRPLYRVVRRFGVADRVLGWAGRERATREVQLTRRRLLNLGLVERALAELRTMAADDTDAHRRRLAAWELVLWHADRSGAEDAAQALRYLAGLGDGVAPRAQRAVIEAECRQWVGDLDGAWQAVHAALAEGAEVNLLLAAANLEADPERRLHWFNRALEQCELPGVELAPVAGGGTGLFDRLRATAGNAAADGADGPLVTVIMPVHNAADTVRTALDSLLGQTWQALEVLVVDDASTDDTVGVVTAYAGADQRVRLIRAEENLGTYVARNLALQQATGEFLTCHDADDWSHPEKIERQVRHLLANPEVVANTSQQVRATTELVSHRRGKPGFFVFANMSSLMFRHAKVVAALGYWDSVRFGADAELQRRLDKAFGKPATVNLDSGPLCLQRQSATSLTGDESYGYHGFFMGARRDYFETYLHHQRQADTLRYEFPQQHRPFPVPEPMRPRRSPTAGRRHFDVVIASDFRLVGGSTMSNLEEVKANRRLGLRTGLVQMNYYDADPFRSVTGKVRDAIDGEQVQMLVHGEQISCDLLIVRYPPVLQHWHRFLPDIDPSHVRVIVNQPPMSDYGPDAVRRYELGRCQQHLQRYWGKPGVWHPIGPLVRRALHQHHGHELGLIDLSDEDWVNVIDVDAWRRPARPAPTGRPRIGRHSRDDPVKWPADAAELQLIYPDTPDVEVHVLGGGRTPQQLLGRIPDNWHVSRFEQLPPAEFLAGLDVFVYFPNAHWVESFGRVIMEAMAAGVPVVLPDSFRPLFGDAAIYAEPAGVRAEVDRLLADDDYYQAWVDLGHRFVEKSFGYTRHAERIERFLNR